MGPNPSIHKLPKDMRSLDLTDKNLSIIPIHFPKKSKLRELILSQNQIRELPKGLRHLATLVMTQNSLEEFSQPMIDCLLTCVSIKNLDFSFNSLHSFPAEWGQLEKLRTINLFGNQLETFPQLRYKVKLLDLGNNRLTDLPPLPEVIKAVNVDGNRIEILNRDHANLGRLTISMNRLKSISPELSFPELAVIDISRNQLTELPDLETMFPNLQQFDASYNMIEVCPRFPKKVSHLLFANNRLKSLPPDFSSLRNLCHADFSGNEIEDVPVLAPVLQTLLLFDNKIKKIARPQPRLQDLTSLFLNDNEITDIPKFGAAEIECYWLMSNKLTTLKVSAFSDKVVSIDVSDNNIETLPASLFELPHLMYIYAARNKIKAIPAVKRSEVILMNLSKNPLEEFSESLPPLLETLYISDCGLTSLPKCVIEAKELINLYANRNNLTEFPYIPGLVRLSLCGNQLVKFPRVAPTCIRLDISMNQIKKMSRRLRFPELVYLDMSHNLLRKFSGTIIAPKLRILKLACCKIKQDLDLSIFPRLECIDTTKGRVQLLNEHSNLKFAMASGHSRSTEKFHLASVKPTTTYVGTLGRDNLMEDIVLLRHKQGMRFYGIFDSRSGGEPALAMSSSVHTVLNSDAEITEDSFGDIVSNVVTTYKEKKLLDGSGFILAMKSGRRISVSSVGGFDAFIVNKSRDRLTFLTDKEAPTKAHFPNIHGNRALDARVLGTTLVYNLEISCKVEVSSIVDDDKFLVIASPTVLTALNESQMLQICNSCREGRELAYAIRNRTYALMDVNNVTVIVVDIEGERQDVSSPERSEAGETVNEESEGEDKSKEEESQPEEPSFIPDVPEDKDDQHCLSCSQSRDNTDSDLIDSGIQRGNDDDLEEVERHVNSDDSDSNYLTNIAPRGGDQSSSSGRSSDDSSSSESSSSSSSETESSSDQDSDNSSESQESSDDSENQESDDSEKQESDDGSTESRSN